MSVQYGGDKITFSDGSTVGSGWTGMKNRIINGDFRIWQRGTSTSGITSGGVFVADRWQTSYGGGSPAGTVTYSRSTNAPTGFKYSARMEQVSSTTSPNEYVLRQFVEMQNAYDLIGKQITLSFYYKSNRTGNHTYRFSHNSITGASSVDGNFTVNSADTWEYKTVVLSGLVNATGSSTADNDWGIHIDVGFKNGSYGLSSINAGDYFQVTGIQLEKGSQASAYEHISYGSQLDLCQRYFIRLTGRNIGYVRNDGQFNSFFSLPTSMRTEQPSGTFTTNGTFTNFATGVASSPSSFSIASESKASTRGWIYVNCQLGSYTAHTWIPSWEGFSFDASSEI
jgi:hypothetical protein